jgi:uncharacterized protein (DUF983 family)
MIASWKNLLYRSQCPHCGEQLNSFTLPLRGTCARCGNVYEVNRTEARLLDGLIFALTVPVLILILFGTYRGLGKPFTWDDWGWWIIPLGLVSHLVWYPRLLRLKGVSSPDQ